MFHEYTEAEKGFAAVWAEKIEPGLALYAPEYERKKRWGIWGSIAAAALVVAIYIYFTFIQPWQSDDAQAVLIIGNGLMGVMLGFLAFYPHTKLVNSYTEFLQGIVANHFADIFEKPENDDAAAAVAGRLEEMKMIKSGSWRDYSNHFIGSYRDCAINMANVDVVVQSGSGSNRSDTKHHHWIIEIGVPIDFAGEVQIRRDYGRLVNSARSPFVKGKQVPFKHEAFEEKFEVYAEDAELAYRLISPAFCDNLLAIDDLLPRGGLGRKRPISGLFQGGKFVLVIHDFADVFETKSVAPAAVEAATRQLIARMNLPLLIVDYLHGDR